MEIPAGVPATALPPSTWLLPLLHPPPHPKSWVFRPPLWVSPPGWSSWASTPSLHGAWVRLFSSWGKNTSGAATGMSWNAPLPCRLSLRAGWPLVHRYADVTVFTGTSSNSGNRPVLFVASRCCKHFRRISNKQLNKKAILNIRSLLLWKMMNES